MFRKSSFILIFCILVQSTTGSSKSKAKYTRLKTAFGGKTMRRADQTFNIHNSCCGKIERKLLTDIKAKLDSLSDKGELSLVHKRFKFWSGVKLISFLALITSS